MISYYVIPGLKGGIPKPESSVVTAVCNHFHLTQSELLSKTNQREIVEPRFIAMTLLHTLSGWSKTRIAKFFNKDHTTVIHSIKRCKTLMQVDNNFRKDYLTIDQRINHPA